MKLNDKQFLNQDIHQQKKQILNNVKLFLLSKGIRHIGSKISDMSIPVDRLDLV